MRRRNFEWEQQVRKRTSKISLDNDRLEDRRLTEVAASLAGIHNVFFDITSCDYKRSDASCLVLHLSPVCVHFRSDEETANKWLLCSDPPVCFHVIHVHVYVFVTGEKKAFFATSVCCC